MSVVCIVLFYLAAQVASRLSPTTTFPIPVYSVQLVAFHGDQWNYNITTTIGQRWAGHLGIRYQTNTFEIYGFNPASPTNMPRSHRTDLLLNGTAYAGKVTNDNHLFEEALHSPHGFTVVFYDVPHHRCTHNDCGYKILRRDFQSSPLNHKLYAYPPSAPRAYRNLNYSACDNTWGESCFNCGTYITSLGIKSVEESGLFVNYIPELAAQPTSFCRCYVGGEWMESHHCVRDYLLECEYRNPPSVTDVEKTATLDNNSGAFDGIHLANELLRSAFVDSMHLKDV